ncbi:MAG: zinc ribbon domain-containing protein [Pirellulaceae bacterium]|nr:zinc ribbon domain-containing protein [Pirellulaceae bacterium]
MFGLQGIIALIVCVAPPLVIVAILIWASRRPKCPNCHDAVSPDDVACPKCGYFLTPRQGR